MTNAIPCYDLVVVGASFAGLVAARTAAMRGLSVAVVEIKPEPGHRVASTGILVKEAAEEIDIPHRLTRRVHGVRLYGPSLGSIDLLAPGYYFLTTETAELLRWLAHEAERAGAHIRYLAHYRGARREAGLFVLDGLDIAARYLLGADGARSAVARHHGLGRNTHFLVGLELELAGTLTADPHFLHCFLDSRHAPGYLAWVASGPSLTQVGLAASAGRKADLAGFLERAGGLIGHQGHPIVGRRAGRIPCGGLVRPWAAPGVMLIGDAAGQVSPATGGGIRLAFHYGRRAGQVIADHLLDLGPPPEAALAGEMPRFATKRAMRALLDLAPPEWLVDAVIATRPMRWLAQHVYFHRRGAVGTDLAEAARRLEQLRSRYSASQSVDGTNYVP
jgi:flavin-dependent dehydrogenase